MTLRLSAALLLPLAIAACESRQPATRAEAAIDRAGSQTGKALDHAAEDTGAAIGRAGEWVRERTR